MNILKLRISQRARAAGCVANAKFSQVSSLNFVYAEMKLTILTPYIFDYNPSDHPV